MDNCLPSNAINYYQIVNFCTSIQNLKLHKIAQNAHIQSIQSDVLSKLQISSVQNSSIQLWQKILECFLALSMYCRIQLLRRTTGARIHA